MKILVDCTLAQHVKVLRLSESLGIEIAAAIGHLVLIWLWTAQYKQDGVLDGISAEDLRRICGYSGDPKKLTDALVKCGFLDSDECFSVHDWEDNGGKLIKRLADDRRRKRNQYKRMREKNSAESPRDIRVISADSPTPPQGKVRKGKERQGTARDCGGLAVKLAHAFRQYISNTIATDRCISEFTDALSRGMDATAINERIEEQWNKGMKVWDWVKALEKKVKHTPKYFTADPNAMPKDVLSDALEKKFLSGGACVNRNEKDGGDGGAGLGRHDAKPGDYTRSDSDSPPV